MSDEYYVAIIVYVSSSDSQSYTPLFEECITLIKASDELSARNKAEEIAKFNSQIYKNRLGDEITWSLYKIIDVGPVLYEIAGDATEIHARRFTNMEAYNAFETLTIDAGVERDV